MKDRYDWPILAGDDQRIASENLNHITLACNIDVRYIHKSFGLMTSEKMGFFGGGHDGGYESSFTTKS